MQEIPPAVARLIERRDRGRCQAPGCRSARWLQIHHIVHREDGGTNDPSNLVCLCFAHHQAHHQGKLLISGTAPDQIDVEFDRWEQDSRGDVESGPTWNRASGRQAGS